MKFEKTVQEETDVFRLSTYYNVIFWCTHVGAVLELDRHDTSEIPKSRLRFDPLNPYTFVKR